MTEDQDTEARILEAARRVFIRHGSGGARVQDIAAEAGVNQALIHYYFGTKEALAERVFVEAARLLGSALRPSPRPGQTLEEMISDFVRGYISTVRRFPFIPTYILAEAHQRPDRLEGLVESALGRGPLAVAGEVHPLLEGIIAERVAAGTLRPMTPRQLLVNVLALAAFPFIARPMLSLAFGMNDDGFEEFLEERMKELPDFIIRGLQP